MENFVSTHQTTGQGSRTRKKKKGRRERGRTKKSGETERGGKREMMRRVTEGRRGWGQEGNEKEGRNRRVEKRGKDGSCGAQL